MTTFTPTLYYYEHCPFCIRVRIFANLFDIKLHTKILLNDDEETPIKMIGQKVVPILEIAPNQFMGESLDIIEYLCQKNNINLEKNQEEIDTVLDFIKENRITLYQLSMPRWSQIRFEEFKTQSAIDYFVNKKSQYIGEFQEAIKNTQQLEKSLFEVLETNSGLFIKCQDKSKSLAAILLYAGIWGVTSVKNIKLPVQTQQFLQKMSESCGVATLESVAIL